MNTNKMWCAACNTMVEAVVHTGISKIMVPAVGTAIGALIGGNTGKTKKDAQKKALLGAVIGTVLGAAGQAVVRKAVPAAQKLVCGSCGCAQLG